MTPQRSSSLIVRCAAEIQPERVQWLWPDRLPVGKCVLVAGEGGLGKSTVLAWIAATISQGGAWPCGEGSSPPGSVLILCAEDGAADTIVPRLMVAGANRSKIHIIDAVERGDQIGSFNLQKDLPALESTIVELGDVLLVIIDPIASYLGNVDSHKNAELRTVLEPLSAMAARLGVTIIANAHFSKSSAGSANHRVNGSAAFVNHARAAFIVVPDPQDTDRRLLIPSKANLGPAREGLAYRIEERSVLDDEGEAILAICVAWEPNLVSLSADEAVAAIARGGKGTRTAKTEALEFLRVVLADGPLAAAEVIEQGRGHGHTEKSIRSARETLGVVVRREGFGAGARWVWAIPPGKRGGIDALCATNPGKGTYGQTQHPQGIAGANKPVDAHHNGKASMEAMSAASNEAGSITGAANNFPEFPAFLDRRNWKNGSPPDEGDIGEPPV
jgi:putative DNA primase/helicase